MKYEKQQLHLQYWCNGSKQQIQDNQRQSQDLLGNKYENQINCGTYPITQPWCDNPQKSLHELQYYHKKKI